MKTTKKAAALSWRETVNAVLQHARINNAPIKEVRLAEQLGVNRGVIHRQLNGERSPARETVESINRAVALLTSDPDVETYLNAVYAAQENLEGNGFSPEYAGFKHAFKLIELYFKPEAFGDIWEVIGETWTSKRRTRLAHAITVAHHRRLTRHLAGVIETRTRLDEMLSICEAHELDIKPLLMRSEEVAVRRAEDEFQLLVRRALAEATTDVAIRNEWERRLVQGMDDFKRAVASGPDVEVYRGGGPDPAIFARNEAGQYRIKVRSKADRQKARV